MNAVPKNSRHIGYVALSISALLIGACSKTPVFDLIQPRFTHIGGGNFKSRGSMPKFADDCIGCDELGDINVFHHSGGNPELTTYTLDANCGEKPNGVVLERGDKLDAGGRSIGKRCIVVMGSEPRIFWTEGDDYWIIGAPAVELLKDFENSNLFRDWKAESEKSSR